MSCSNEKTEEQYDAETALINEMFSTAKFCVAIDYDELNEVVTDQPNIVIKNTYNCYCYDDNNRNTDYFYITAKNGEAITNKFIIEELIKQQLCLECNHVYLEGFMQSKDSECQFEIVIGS